LALAAGGPEDYLKVYSTLLQEVDQPVILHWLGTMFDPALAGYWGSDDAAEAAETFLSLIRDNAEKVDGVKVSLLDASHEVALRAALPEGVRLYTGDDFNYPELIDGEGSHHSDALLGIFAAIFLAASVAPQHYDAGDAAKAREIPDSTRDLGKHIFSAPTFYYKTGIAFMSWPNRKQPVHHGPARMQAAHHLEARPWPTTAPRSSKLPPGTTELFLVVGGLAPGEKDVVAARRRVADRLADLVPFAGENGIRLVLEPLHPMYAADRALISALGQALDLAAPFDAHTVVSPSIHSTSGGIRM